MHIPGRPGIKDRRRCSRDDRPVSSFRAIVSLRLLLIRRPWPRTGMLAGLLGMDAVRLRSIHESVRRWTACGVCNRLNFHHRRRAQPFALRALVSKACISIS